MVTTEAVQAPSRMLESLDAWLVSSVHASTQGSVRELFMPADGQQWVQSVQLTVA